MIRFEQVTYTYPFQAEPAVREVSFSVRPGELVLCTGVSGCGKSTLMRLANGLCPHYYHGTLEGEVRVGGVANAARALHEISRDAGTLFQNPEEQFFALNVEDEIVFAHEWRATPREDIRRALERVSAAFSLAGLLDASVHELSEGQKQKVGLASIISQQPGALILDEPTANLDPEATGDLARHLLELKRTGMAILVVDHRLYWLAQVADRVLVMDRGRIVADGDFSLLHDAALRERYGLRKSVVRDPRAGLAEASDAPARLEVENLSFAYPGRDRLFSGVACSLPAGLTALVGDNGTGKTTLARLLTGLNRADSGRFSLDGRPLAPDRLLEQAGLVLQNADHQLYMKTVLDEVLTCLKLARPPKVGAETLRVEALGLLDRLALGPLALRHPQSLSGGEKQRLVIACALAKQPELLILDEPTSGLDGRNMWRIATALKDCARRGACVLLITHDLELMDAVCTRALRLPLKPARAVLSPERGAA